MARFKLTSSGIVAYTPDEEAAADSDLAAIEAVQAAVELDNVAASNTNIRLALQARGIYDNVDSAISRLSNSEEVEIQWNNSSLISRLSPWFVDLTAEMGITAEVRSTIFDEANALYSTDNLSYNKNDFLFVQDSTLENFSTGSSVSVSTKGAGTVSWNDSYQRLDLDSDFLITSDVQSLMDSDFTVFVEFKGNTDHFTLLHVASDSGSSPSFSQPLVNIIDGQVYAGIDGTTATITSDSNAVDDASTYCIGLTYNKQQTKLTLSINNAIVGSHTGDTLALSGNTHLLIGGASDNYTSNFGWSTYNGDLQGSITRVRAWEKVLSSSEMEIVKNISRPVNSY
jgi:hypothetical protein